MHGLDKVRNRSNGGGSVEIQILDWLYSLHSPVMDRIMIFITSLGDGGIFWIAAAVLLLFSKKTRRWGIAMGVAMLLGFIIVNLGVKPLVHRTRPYEVKGLEELLIKRPSDYSFPSGHTQVSFAAAWIWYVMDRRAGIFALLLAVVIAFSRMYLYVHYPTDILAGFLCGSLWAYLAMRICRVWPYKRGMK